MCPGWKNKWIDFLKVQGKKWGPGPWRLYSYTNGQHCAAKTEWNDLQTSDITNTIIYILLLCPCSESRTYKSTLFFLIVRNRKQYSYALCLHMLAYEFRIGTASSNWWASGKSTTLLQLHLDLQIPGCLVAGWNTLPGVIHLQWPYWGTPWGGSGNHYSSPTALGPLNSRRFGGRLEHPARGDSPTVAILGNSMGRKWESLSF